MFPVCQWAVYVLYLLCQQWQQRRGHIEQRFRHVFLTRKLRDAYDGALLAHGKATNEEISHFLVSIIQSLYMGDGLC